MLPLGDNETADVRRARAESKFAVAKAYDMGSSSDPATSHKWIVEHSIPAPLDPPDATVRTGRGVTGPVVVSPPEHEDEIVELYVYELVVQRAADSFGQPQVDRQFVFFALPGVDVRQLDVLRSVGVPGLVFFVKTAIPGDLYTTGDLELRSAN